MEAEILRAILSLRRLFEETITIENYVDGEEKGMVKTITIETKTEAGQDVTIILNFTYEFENGVLKRTVIHKMVG